jgi:hypothetical protein
MLSVDMLLALRMRRSIRFAPGATPRNVRVNCGPVEDSPLPAAMPATYAVAVVVRIS